MDRLGIEPNKDGLQGLPALQRAAHVGFALWWGFDSMLRTTITGYSITQSTLRTLTKQKSALSASAGLAVGLSAALVDHVRLLRQRLNKAGFCPRSEAPIPCGRLALATCRAVGASCSAEVRGARDKAISATRSAIIT